MAHWPNQPAAYFAMAGELRMPFILIKWLKTNQNKNNNLWYENMIQFKFEFP